MSTICTYQVDRHIWHCSVVERDGITLLSHFPDQPRETGGSMQWAGTFSGNQGQRSPREAN